MCIRDSIGVGLTQILLVLKKKQVEKVQAADGIRDEHTSRGLGDVYKRQMNYWPKLTDQTKNRILMVIFGIFFISIFVLLFLLMF